jgi:hypothetical protein
MKFIGNLDYLFNRNLIKLLNTEYTVISCMDQNYNHTSNDKKQIWVLPVTNEFDYFKSVDVAWNCLTQSALYSDMTECTAVFVVMPNLHTACDIAAVINSFDKTNQVDNIWIYPTPTANLKLRDNEITNLPWQLRSVL